MARPPAQRSAASILVSHVDYPKPADGGNTCDWCFKSLPEDTFKGEKWQEHVNEDHRPFVCISEKCMKSTSLPRFPSWRKWLQHMVDTHGTEWHRQVHAPSQWRCPLCDDSNIRFFSPEDLMEHFEGKHDDMALTSTRKGNIVRQSRASYPRPRNECPLCCLPIKDEEIYSHHRKKNNDNKRDASKRTPMPESEKKRLKTETGQQTSTLPIGEGGPKPSSPSATLAPEVVARHIAGHLRTVMLLTLRIISIDGPVEVSSDKESVSGKTDDQLSRVASSRGDLGERTDISAASSHPGDLAEGYRLQDLEDTIPEQDEIIAWPDVRGEENSLVDDFLQQVVNQGAFQSHSGEDKNRTTETSWTSNKVEGSSQEQPHTKEAFDIAWRAFERRLSEREQRLALRAFQWLLYARLSDSEELSMVMLIDPDSDEVDELNGEAEKLLRRGGIGDLCGSLLTCDVDNDVWEFKNRSAEEYFETNHYEASQGLAFVSMTCLKFLITDPCAANRTNCRCGGNASTMDSPCSVFRANILDRLQLTENTPTCHDKRLAELEKRFFGSPQSSSIAYRTWAQTWNGTSLVAGKIGDCLKPVSSPLFAMATFGIFRLLKDWWLDPRTDLGIRNDQGYSLLELAHHSIRDEIRRLVESCTPTMPPKGPSSSSVPSHDNSGTSGINSRSTPADDNPEFLSSNHHPRHSSGESPQTRGNFSFLFILNKLLIREPERDNYHSLIPPRQPEMYRGEIPSKVMRYSNGKVSEAVGYYWYRPESGVSGYLMRLNSSSSYLLDPSTGEYCFAQEYKTFAVFACNPLLPLMVIDTDPLVYPTNTWELLRIFHPRNHFGLSQVMTLESPLGDGGAPVRPHDRAPHSDGLGGELGIILGLMALTADHSHNENQAVNKAFLEKRHWHRNEWWGPKIPKGYPDTAQDDPNGFLSIVFLDPENPNSTEESLQFFEWQTPIVRESRAR
ncbi:hypothetical protein CEP52_002371 [Fusarium oligoseptatum]|uniref:Uncharacterized protein n=1 Tax=Fusarium oligoseptatum TaxID=2604345 RepID=A0A428UE58_9HYPO|nr:hypothetical protein CEP52_002371 [Fusarium oligoseptatum]